MAFVRLAFFPGGTASHQAAIAAALEGAPVMCERLAFAAGPVDGGWQVVQIWTERAALDRFNETWFLPALARAGDRAFPQPPVVRDFDAADAWIGDSTFD